MASDGSGWTMTVDATPEASAAYDIHGNKFDLINAKISDPNGNTITGFTDTLGMTALSISGSGTPSSPKVYQYTAAGNVSEQVTVKYTYFNLKTNFGCSGVTEANFSSIPLVTEIDLPDINTYPSHKYTLAYEGTPGYSGYYTGRLASITLPTGGQISYAYQGSNNGVECADGSVPKLQRTVSGSGITTGVWTYDRTAVSGGTTITDPLNNQTLVYFQGLYETQRNIYQGSTSGTLLKQIDTCYNGASIPCTGSATSPPFTNETVQTTIPGLLISKVYTTFNTYELPTEKDEYDWGGSSPVRKTLITYATPGGYINDRAQSITVCAPGARREL